MTKRSDEEEGRRDPRRERNIFAVETQGATLGQKFADALDRRRKTEGKNEGQKGFPKAPYGAL